MFKFIYAKHKIHPKVSKQHEQWYLLIDNVESLRHFLEARNNQLVRAYDNVKIKSIRDNIRTGHFTNRDESIIDTILSFDDTRKTLLDDCKHLDNLLRGYIHAFQIYGHIIISPNNAFRMMDDTFKILQRVERKAMVFPISSIRDIRIIKWPNGTHYYAKIGNTDVFYKGKQKWDSKREAMRNAKAFFKELDNE